VCGVCVCLCVCVVCVCVCVWGVVCVCVCLCVWNIYGQWYIFLKNIFIANKLCTTRYVYWTVHHSDSWRIRDQLDVTCYYVLFHFFYAQHVSDINTPIIRSLRLFYCITTLVVCSCFDVCWSFGVAVLGWYLCSRLKHSCATPKPQHTSKQEHTTNVMIQ